MPNPSGAAIPRGWRIKPTNAAGARSVVVRRNSTREVLVSSVAQPPGITRTDLQRADLGAPGREMIQNRVDIGPEAPAIRHKHPGEEIIYVLEGSGRACDLRGREGKPFLVVVE